VTQLHPATTVVTVQGNLDALQAERDSTWTRERVAVHAALRQGLEDAADRSRFVRVGDIVPPFTLDEVDGGTVDLVELVKSGPAVVIFFRFEACPACNVALPAYRDALAPELAALGVALVAVSPQVPEKLRPIKSRLGLDFLVASDADAKLIRSFGIAFGPDEDEREVRRRNGTDLAEVLGNGRWELPYPTVVVIDRDRVVRFADVHPNWMVRTEAVTVVEAVRRLV
jgi:peroxiredoxin